jgi:Cu-processing system permease protein
MAQDTAIKVSRYVLYDVIKGKVIPGYTLFLLIISFSLFSLDDQSNKAMLSLLNIVTLVVPLVSLVFTTIHYYNSYEFMELMLSQPVSRPTILLSEFIGMATSLALAFLIGVGLPILIYAPDETGFALLASGCMQSIVFCAIAFLASVASRDKARGIGLALLLWFYFAIIYDGLILLLLFAFADYPMEKLTLALSSLNPIDLGRIFVMLRMDVSALMGYTGATYKQFFGSSFGSVYTLIIMGIWIIAPISLALRVFKKKDL